MMAHARTAKGMIAVTAAALAIPVFMTAASSAAPAQAAHPVAANTATTVSACTATDLGVWVAADEGDGAAGSIYFPLEFTNISGHTCSLYGFPGVSAIRRDGKQLGSPARRNHAVAPRIVKLAPGATAHTVLQYIDAAVFTSSCRPRPAYQLKIYPPDQFRTAHAFWDMYSCSVKGRIYMTVQAIQPGVLGRL